MCNQYKLKESFFKDKTRYDGVCSCCKQCSKDKQKKFINNNSGYYQKYYIENKDKLLKQSYDRNKANPERKKEYDKKWKSENKGKVNSYSRKHHKKNQVDILYRLKRNIQTRTSQFIRNKGLIRNKRTIDILGCSIPFLYKHLEEQFTDGMNWDNYGDWHVDHIIPLSSAETEERMYELGVYTNLQPLWAKENLSKGNKIL